MGEKRKPSTFSITETAATLLTRLADAAGTSKTAVLERLIRREAKSEGVVVRSKERGHNHEAAK